MRRYGRTFFLSFDGTDCHPFLTQPHLVFFPLGDAPENNLFLPLDIFPKKLTVVKIPKAIPRQLAQSDDLSVSPDGCQEKPELRKLLVAMTYSIKIPNPDPTCFRQRGATP